jgi:DNA-binding NtrC family response regulator
LTCDGSRQGNRSEAVRQLAIGRPQLYAKMEEYGIGRDELE